MIREFHKRLFSSFKQIVNLNSFSYKSFSNHKNFFILGIETSCDDTGCAVLNEEGTILGESLNSQHLIHLNNGGIIPPFAQNLHRKNIENVVNEAIKQANLSFYDLDAVAVTVKPGLPLSLSIGMKYGKHLCRLYKKPFIPIHHMQAHALTARMHDKTIQFPFLVLLISGGHCLLALAQDINKFLILGQTLDDAPGELFDKVARRLKLKNLQEFSKLSGGNAIELSASKADNPLAFKFTTPLGQHRDCNFSFSGLKNQCIRQIILQEQKFDLPPDGIIPDVHNVCAALQLTVARHLCHQVQRGMEYVHLKNLISKEAPPTLVVSGGVACNDFIAHGLEIVCEEFGYRLARPPPKLCTDNGIMIAWNGVEKWRRNVDITNDLDSITIEGTSPLGENKTADVKEASIQCNWIKIGKLITEIQQEKILQNI